MQILLGDGLRDEDRVGVELDRLGDEHAVGNLAAEVVGVERAVALQPVVAVKALQVEHRVDPDAVRVGARARADDDDLAAQLALAKSSISSSVMYSMSKPSPLSDA